MLAAIGFNNQFQFRAGEVRDKWSDRNLALEFVSRQAAIAQEIPELAFGLGLVASQFAGPVSVGMSHPLTLPSPPEGGEGKYRLG